MSNAEATILGVYKRVLTVRSTKPKEEFSTGGSMYGYEYEWGINHFTFTNDKQKTMEFYGLTEEQYVFWESQFTHKYDRNTNQWYGADIIDDVVYEDDYDEELVDIVDSFSD